MQKENFNFRDYIIKNKTKVISEFEIEFKKMVSAIKKYNPYDILSHLNCFFKMTLFNVRTEYDASKESIDLKYSLELIQMIVSCIPDNEFVGEQIQESDIYQLIDMGAKIHSLKIQYIWAYTYELIGDKAETDQAQYIFESEINSDITGKRYDIFEVQHYIDLFVPLKEIFENTYNFSIDQLFEGIDKLKKKFMFGTNDTIEKMRNIIDTFDPNTFPEEERINVNNIMEEMFGLKLQNVGEITNWPIEFLDILSYKNGDNSFLLENLSIEQFYELHKGINRKPILKLNNNYYYLNIHRLLDNLDRIILKDLYRKNKNDIEIIKKITANTCEKLVGSYIKNIIPSAEVLISNYYKSDKKTCENDVLVIFGNYLFIVEVKSGSFTPDVAMNNIESHLNSLKDLIQNADSQANRFMMELEKNNFLNIYESNDKKSPIKKTIKLNDYREIFKMAITLENFNEIEARADKLGILDLNKNIIVCSLDDLKVYSDYFEHNPTQFLHYMTYRRLSTNSVGIELRDELDHLGLYIEHNCYPITAKKMIESTKGKVNGIDWGKIREKLDLYYSGKYIGGKYVVDKPKQINSLRLNELIQFANNKNDSNLISIVCDLLDMDGKEQENLSNNFEIMIKHYINTKKVKYVFLKNCFDNLVVLSCIVCNDEYNVESIFDEVYANMKITNSNESNVLFLFYDKDKKLYEIKYFVLTSNDLRFLSEEIDYIVEKIKSRRLEKELSKKGKKKIGRNELCPCGSGLKYKKCCGK